MTTRDTYSVGAPCWVDTFQPDPSAAMDFYGPLFGWSFDDPTPMPAGLEGNYFAARLRGRWWPLASGNRIAGPAADALMNGRLDDQAIHWLQSNFLKTELELGHCLRLPACARQPCQPANTPRNSGLV